MNHEGVHRDKAPAIISGGDGIAEPLGDESSLGPLVHVDEPLSGNLKAAERRSTCLSANAVWWGLFSSPPFFVVFPIN